jgi:hypothetical protein
VGTGAAASRGQDECSERARCAAVVERWNAAPTHDWSPAIGTVLKAGYRWLDVYCGEFERVINLKTARPDQGGSRAKSCAVNSSR